MPKQCPECNREMRHKTSRTPETAWRCDYCAATWTSVESFAVDEHQDDCKGCPDCKGVVWKGPGD